MPTFVATYTGSVVRHKGLKVTVWAPNHGAAGDQAINWFRARGVKDPPMSLHMVEVRTDEPTEGQS